MQLAAFLGVSILLIVTPGPDTALTIRNALIGGRTGGVATAAGVATGQAIWTLAASAGVAALLRGSEPAFVALRLAGGFYLVLLGVRSLVAAVRGVTPLESYGGASGLAAGVAFRQGVLSNLGNPKMAVFFTSLLPQFGATSFGGLLALGLVFCTLTLAWLTGYGVAVARVGAFLRRTRVRRALDAATGTVLVSLGLRLAADRG